MLRSIFKLKDKIKYSEIKEKTKIMDISYFVKKLIFKYAGHLTKEKYK